MHEKPTYEELEKRVKALEAGQNIPTARQPDLGMILSPKLLYHMFESLHIPTTLTKVEDGLILYANKSFTELIGYGSTADIIGQHTTELQAWADPEERKAVMEEIQEKGFVRDREIQVRNQSGVVRTCLFSAQGIKFDKEEYLLATSVDITERKQAENELKRYHNQLMVFKQFAEGSNQGMGWADLEGRIVYINQALCRMFGVEKPEAVYGKPVQSTFYSERIEKQLNDVIFPTVLREGKWQGESEIRTQIGKSLPTYESLFLIKDRDGDPLYFANVLSDITEHKQAEEALRESEEKFRTVVANSWAVIFILNREGELELSEGRALKSLGLEPGQAVGQSAFELYKDYPHVIQSIEGALKGITTHAILEIGDVIFEVFYNPLKDPSGNVYRIIGIATEITERRQLEEQLRQSHKMEAVGTLTGGIAHDFNNILGIIMGNTELALQDVPDWNPAHFNLEEIESATLRAADIVRQLLSFSRKTDQKLKPIGLVTVIKDALKFLRSTIPTTIEIRKNIPSTDQTILADPIQINQIMMNLCINASQEMEQTGGILEITVETVTLDEVSIDNYPALTEGDYVRIAVSDSGPGIDPKIIDRIFDPYFTTKEVGKGSGMGLAVVLGIVKNHGGAITVDSEPGKGATFSILFPVVSAKPEGEAGASHRLPFGSETILFVDDEKSIVNMTGRMLKRLGYKVETRLNPEEALALFQLKPERFDLVITDMTMPQMTGVQLTDELKKIRRDIPIIICTGHSSLIDEEKAKDMGIAAYVMKPINMSSIATTIRNVLDKNDG